MKRLIILLLFLLFTRSASAALLAEYLMEQDFGNNGPVRDNTSNGFDGLVKFNVQGGATCCGGKAEFPGDVDPAWIKLPESSVATGSEATISMTANVTGTEFLEFSEEPIKWNDYLWYDADGAQDNKRAIWYQGYSDLLFAELNGPSGTVVEFTVDYSAHVGQDTDILFTFQDSNEARLEINGVEVAQKDIGSGKVTPLASRAVDSVVLGRNDGTGNGQWLQGTLDNVRIFDNYTSGSPSIGLSGDYNEDGKVNAADYTVWRDGNSPDSTTAGYDLWVAHFGNTAGAASGSQAVPEPTSLALLLGLSLVVAANRSQRLVSKG